MGKQIDRTEFSQSWAIFARGFWNASTANDKFESFYDALRFFEIDHVWEAFDRTKRALADGGYPTAAMIAKFARTAEQEEAIRERASLVEIEEVEHVRKETTERNMIPADPQGMQRYIEDAKNTGDKLARIFRCESKSLGLDPAKPSPKDIARRRLDDIYKLLGTQDAKTQEPKQPTTPVVEEDLPV